MTTSNARALRRRVAISSYLGATLEYYDFLLYGSAAALVFSKVFFSGLSPVLGTIVALATLAAGYFARFAGAILFGHFGDRVGRKRVMLITMSTMGTCSGLIGLLPSYAGIGAAAPILLLVLRIVQGLAVGGEYGGAVLMASEHAGTRGRGLAASAAAMGGPSGAVLATGAMTLVALLHDEALVSWGWRIPFVASFVLLALGLWFRSRIEESPVFRAEAAATGKTGRTRSPLVELLRNDTPLVLKSVLVQIAGYSGQGVFGVFILSYAPTQGYPPATVLFAVMLGTIVSVIATPMFGVLSDRVGRRAVLLIGTLANGVAAFPMFLAINSGRTGPFLAAIIIYIGLIMTTVTAVAPVFLSELFGTAVRYTGVSASYQLAQVIGSGLAPLIAASLLAGAGGPHNTVLIAGYLVALAVISAAAALRIPDNTRVDLAAVGTRAADGDRRRHAPVIDA